MGERKVEPGHYVWDKEKMEFVLKRSGNPSLGLHDASGARVYCPDGGYVSNNLGHKPVHVKSARHKAAIMRERGLVERG